MERIVESPVGTLKIEGDDRSITGIWLNAKGSVTPGRAAGVLAELERQLDAYFAGSLKTFDLPLAPKGTPFQLEVWSALQAIPYGETCSYSDIAKKIDRADAMRAVGAANGQNPIPIVIPCHRVIGASGSLTGFGGGLAMKRWLLAHENGLWSMLNGQWSMTFSSASSFRILVSSIGLLVQAIARCRRDIVADAPGGQQ